MNSETPANGNQPVLTAPLSETETAPLSSPAPSPDLSAEIGKQLERQPGDRVRVVRVWGDHYRCNWIAPKNRLDVLETFVVRQSQFLHATRSPDGSLRIRVVGGA
jgi:hypothetical protein